MAHGHGGRTRFLCMEWWAVAAVKADGFDRRSEWLAPVVRPEVIAEVDTRSTQVDAGIVVLS